MRFVMSLELPFCRLQCGMESYRSYIGLTVFIIGVLQNAGATQTFNETTNRNVTVKFGNDVNITWTYSGGDTDLDAIKWSTYIPKVKKDSNLKDIYGLKVDGSRDSTPEQPLYKDRLVANKNGGTLTFGIKNVTSTDGNVYYCTLVNTFAGEIRSSELIVIVNRVVDGDGDGHKDGHGDSDGDGLSAGEKAGIGVAGGVVLCGIIVVVVVVLVKKKKKDEENNAATQGGERTSTSVHPQEDA